MPSSTPTFFDRFNSWRLQHLSDQTFRFLVASAIGLVTGAAAALLKWMIRLTSKLLTVNFSADSFNYPLLLLPVAGIVLAVFFQRYTIRADMTHGVNRLLHDIAVHRLRLPPRLMWGAMVASTLTLGFGGSAGSEGPIAYTGAAIGSNFGRWMGLSRRPLLVMVGCGAAAGIAGIFKAPIGGVLFALEVLKVEFTTVSVMMMLVACVISAMTAYCLAGFTVDLSYLHIGQFDPSIVAYIALLGVVCGFYSVYYSAVMKGMAKLYERIANIWLRAAASGICLAVILFFLPAMFGEGYGIMDKIVNGDFGSIVGYGGIFRNLDDPWSLILAAGLVVLLKAFAASASNSGGGVAGDFAPTLFAGCFVGCLFAMVLNRFFGLGLPVETMAFLGMAGVMAGAIRAPLMALFLTAEMTNGFILFLPLLGVTAISYGIVRFFRGPDYYHEPHDLHLT